jgi:hypothetical protein
MASKQGKKISVTKTQSSDVILSDIRKLIKEARSIVAVVINAGLTILYWCVGRPIIQDVIGGKRAGYGEKIVATLSRLLVRDYGRVFSEKNLRRMMQFADIYPEEEIVVTLSRHLSWIHFLVLIPLEKPFQREFYSGMCQVEGWSVSTGLFRILLLKYIWEG